MSDHTTEDRTQIDIGVGILVGLCGYTPEQAFTELTAFSHRHKVGLISTSRALTLLAQSTTPNPTDHSAVEEARSRWQHILHSGADQPPLERTAQRPPPTVRDIHRTQCIHSDGGRLPTVVHETLTATESRRRRRPRVMPDRGAGRRSAVADTVTGAARVHATHLLASARGHHHRQEICSAPRRRAET